MQFSELGLITALLSAVAAEGYVEPTPIQIQAIPHVLAGRDLLGLAQTGTGKTAAFALPILQRFSQKPAPRSPRPIRCLPQVSALRRGVDILVATPGRLLDLAGQGYVDLRPLEVFVLDEADRMLDMGFIHDVRRVIALLPRHRQTLFFSATMPREAQELADQLLRDPETVAVVPPATTVEKVDQEVYFVEKGDKRALLVDVLREAAMRRVLVFSRTKHGANRIAEHLVKNDIGAEAIHGNKSQNARERALAGFKAGRMRVLVATDIAARGIDIDDVTHVINFDIPEVPETYVHRIGRTARAGAAGMAMSFCDAEERADLRAIEKLTRQQIPVVEGHPYESRVPFSPNQAPRPAPPVRAPHDRGHGELGRRGRSRGGRRGGRA